MAVCGLTAFLWSFDPNSYKNALQVLVQQRLDRQLTIQGDLKVVFFPDIAIQAKAVSLSEKASQDVFASVEDLRATIAIFPLLNNHLVIQEISLTGLKAQVQRTQLGHFLFEDLLGWGKDAAPSAQVSDVGLLMDDISIDIAEILIKKSEFTVLDASRKATWKLQDASLEFGRITKGEPFKAELNARIQHADSLAQAKLSAQAILNVDLVSREFSAKNLNASFKGDLPEKIWLEEILKKVDLSVTSAAIRVAPTAGRLRVERFALRAKGLRDGAAFEYSADAPLLDISNLSAQAETLTSRLRVDGVPAIDARIVLDGLQGNRHKLLFERSSLDLAIKREAHVLKVTLSSPVEMQPFVTAVTMKALQGEVQTLLAPVAKTLLTMPFRGRLSVVIDPAKDAPLPIHVVGQADNLPFAALLASVGMESVLEGNAAIDFRVGFAPAPMPQLKQSLLGTAQLRLANASLAGVDLGAGLDALRAIAVTDKPGVAFVLDRSKHTLFDTAEFELRLDRDVVHLQRVKMLAPGWTIQQASPGKINLHNDTIDIALLLNLLGPQSLTIKRATIQVRSLMVPLQVKGPVTQPEVSIQWTALDRDPLGRALKDKLTIPSAELRSLASPPNQGTQKK
jgi:hypothetical protein